MQGKKFVNDHEWSELDGQFIFERDSDEPKEKERKKEKPQKKKKEIGQIGKHEEKKIEKDEIKTEKKKEKFVKLTLIDKSEKETRIEEKIVIKKAGLEIMRKNNEGKANVLIIDDTTISLNHSQIMYCCGFFLMSDLKSTNGTFINIPIGVKTPIVEGMKIDTGIHELTVVGFNNSILEIRCMNLENKNSVSYEYDFKSNKNPLTIGKDKTQKFRPDFYHLNDQFLEPEHAKFSIEGDCCLLEVLPNAYG